MTFQRLGLREASETLLSEVEGCQGFGYSRFGNDSSVSTRNVHHQQGMEMLTPSPVSLVTAEQSLVQEGHSLPPVTLQPGKLQLQFTRLQVRLQEEESHL